MKAGDQLDDTQIKVGMVIRAVSNYSRTVIEGEVTEVPGSPWAEVFIEDNFGISVSDYTVTLVEVGAEEVELINSVIRELERAEEEESYEDIALNVIALVRKADAA